MWSGSGTRECITLSMQTGAGGMHGSVFMAKIRNFIGP